MRAQTAARRKSQAGFTLVELIIATALGLVVMGALTSVVLTTSVAGNTAIGRIEASAQVRGFQFIAYDDFALARAPAPTGCAGTLTAPCTTQDLLLHGSRVVNDAAVSYTVRYAWDSNRKTVTREVGGSTRVAASNVTAYSWYVDSTGANPTVVVSMTVTIPSYNASYSESQTLRFYPRITVSPSP